MAKRSERNKIRFALWRCMQDCEKMRVRVEEIGGMYVASGNDDHAAYVSQLGAPIEMLAKAFERVRSEL